MKIAIISDIHSNLPALEACLIDIDNKKPDAIYCLGDLVGYNIWANEVTEIIRDRMIPTIKGNYDEGVGNNSDDCGCAYKTEVDKANGVKSISFTNEIITPDNRQYLKLLPSQFRIEFHSKESKMNILLVHGSPRKINEYLFEDRSDENFLKLMNNAGADIMFFGHTHKPFHKTISNGDGNFKHAINTGSVGKPKDGNPMGGYVMLSLNENSSLKTSDGINVEFIRFDYDIEKAALAVEQSPLPDVFAKMLREGE